MLIKKWGKIKKQENFYNISNKFKKFWNIFVPEFFKFNKNKYLCNTND